MTEEQVKSQYRAIHAPQNLRGQVLAACAAARRQRAGQRKKFASMAACLAVVLCLSVYGLSPVPAIASGGQTVDRGGAAVAAETVDLFGGTQTRTAAVFALEPEGGSEIETCISLAIGGRTALLADSRGQRCADGPRRPARCPDRSCSQRRRLVPVLLTDTISKKFLRSERNNYAFFQYSFFVLLSAHCNRAVFYSAESG